MLRASAEGVAVLVSGCLGVWVSGYLGILSDYVWWLVSGWLGVCLAGSGREVED
jgi:hypothetical protein